MTGEWKVGKKRREGGRGGGLFRVCCICRLLAREGVHSVLYVLHITYQLLSCLLLLVGSVRANHFGTKTLTWVSCRSGKPSRSDTEKKQVTIMCSSRRSDTAQGRIHCRVDIDLPLSLPVYSIIRYSILPWRSSWWPWTLSAQETNHCKTHAARDMGGIHGRSAISLGTPGAMLLVTVQTSTREPEGVLGLRIPGVSGVHP
ncbi:hypothetical protein L209DRAFT_565467 [Thermothelomyces heterothallicus CBS 203.75]